MLDTTCQNLLCVLPEFAEAILHVFTLIMHSFQPASTSALPFV